MRFGRNTGNAFMKLGLLWRLISPKFSSKLQEVTREAFQASNWDMASSGLFCFGDSLRRIGSLFARRHLSVAEVTHGQSELRATISVFKMRPPFCLGTGALIFSVT